MAYLQEWDLTVDDSDPSRVWDASGERFLALPPGQSVENLKAFVPLINRAFKEGVSLGERELQNKLKVLLDIR